MCWLSDRGKTRPENIYLHTNILRSTVKFPDQTNEQLKSYGQKTAENYQNKATFKNDLILDSFLAITF